MLNTQVVQVSLDPHLMYALANGCLYIPWGCTFTQLAAIVESYQARFQEAAV